MEAAMKKWLVFSCVLLLAMTTMLASQTSAPVPAGTALMVKLETTLATFSNKAGDPFRGSLRQPVVRCQWPHLASRGRVGGGPRKEGKRAATHLGQAQHQHSS